MIKQKQMTEKELEQVSGGSHIKNYGVTRIGLSVGPVSRIGIEPNPSPAPRFRHGRIGIAPLPSP